MPNGAVSVVPRGRQNELVNELRSADPDHVGTATTGTTMKGLRLGGKLLAAAAILASFLVWVYAYSGFAGRDAPDLLDDPTFATAGESVCATALDDLAELPNALDATDGADRAAQIRTSTARLERMLTDLDEIVGGTERDVAITTAWLADWRVLMDDRYRYADKIEVDDNAQFLITDTGVGERLDRRITRFATTNSMLSCIAPSDVG